MNIKRLLISIVFLLCFIAGTYAIRLYRNYCRIEQLTILEVEGKYPIEILSPMVRELQQHANRHGASLKEDNIWGPNTLAGTGQVRINQESSKHNWMYYEVEK